MVMVNGEEQNKIAGLTISQMLEQLEYGEKRVAVEINEEIISSKAFDETIINDGDIVEVIMFVGGGSN